MIPYADLDNLLADYLPDVSSPAEIAGVGRILQSVTAMIDRACYRPSGFFAQAAVDPSSKIFYGTGENFLPLPPHASAIVPDNVTVPGMSPKPYFVEYGDDDLTRGLHTTDRNGILVRDFSLFLGWQTNVPFTISARWGWATIPPDIQEAARQATVRFWQLQKGVLGQINPDGYIVERSLPKAVVDLLKPYVLEMKEERKKASTGAYFVDDFYPEFYWY